MHADPAEAQAFLDQHPDVDAVQLAITDANGVARGKAIAREELLPMYRHGRHVAGSILGLDSRGEDVEETGLVWSSGDADKLCWPLPGRLRVAPWLRRPSAQLLMTMHEADGRPAAADPRHALARVVARLAADGYTAGGGGEPGFYLLETDGDRIRPARGLLGGQPAPRHDTYGLGKLEEMAPLFDELYHAAAQQGLPARTLMSEYAPAQFEVSLAHRADALAAAADAERGTRCGPGGAPRHGLTATFMAKPFGDLAGCGLHVHVSLADAAGRNLFAADDPAGTPLLRQGIAGLAATMAESMAVFAPNANSYRLFRRLSYAPVAATWGVNNRSVGFRVPAGPPDSRHVEHRICGADANPYLAIATVLAGLHHGIRGRLDPGPPVSGNGYELPPDPRVPLDWHAALAAAARSTFLNESLGADFMNVFMAIKRAECERFSAEPTALDHAWYLKQA